MRPRTAPCSVKGLPLEADAGRRCRAQTGAAAHRRPAARATQQQAEFPGGRPGRGQGLAHAAMLAAAEKPGLPWAAGSDAQLVGLDHALATNGHDVASLGCGRGLGLVEWRHFRLADLWRRAACRAAWLALRAVTWGVNPGCRTVGSSANPAQRRVFCNETGWAACGPVRVRAGRFRPQGRRAVPTVPWRSAGACGLVGPPAGCRSPAWHRWLSGSGPWHRARRRRALPGR